MKRILIRFAQRYSLAAVMAVLVAAPAAAQIDSRTLGPNWPTLLLPPHVLEAPQPQSLELEAPLLAEVLESSKNKVTSSDAAALLGEETDGDPEATTLDKMMNAPREVVSLARDGKYKQAIEKGKPLLEQETKTYGDFTWDILTTAVAWSQLQNGDYADSIVSWRKGGAKIKDITVRQYHLIVARVIDRYQKESPDELPRLKEPANLQAEVIKELKEPVTQLLRSLELTKTVKHFEGRLNNLSVAYNHLRLVMAVDRDTGEKLLGEYFRPAVDALVKEGIEANLEAANKQYQALVRAEEKPLMRSGIAAWNAEVTKHWNMIRQVKRLCRIHNYLQRLELAGNVDNSSPFEAAHELLFAPGELRYVWQTTGRSTSAGFDMNRRAPSSETPSRTELREELERQRRDRGLTR